VLSTLITTLQSSLLASRSYLFGSLLPVLLAVLGSDMVTRLAFPRVHSLAAQLVTENTWMLLLLIVFAYVFSVLVEWLRRLLEDLPFVFGRLRLALLQHQIYLAETARRELEKYEELYLDLVQQDWTKQLREARKAGSKAPLDSGAKDRLKAVEQKLIAAGQNDVKGLSLATLMGPLGDLKELLDRYSANDNDKDSKYLGSLHEKASDLVRYVERALQTLQLRAFENYAAFPDSIAPTRMGNIAGTLRSYAQTRYGMPLDIVWTRFQRVLQDDEKLSGTLQDAKIQLDFLVSLTWLAGAFTFVWSIVLGTCARASWTFLAVSVMGPLLVFSSYRLACRAYRIFAEVMRGAVDLHRFDLLAELRLPLPTFPEQERETWRRVSDWLGAGNNPDGTFFRHKE
jgi:hypothetical protein